MPFRLLRAGKWEKALEVVRRGRALSAGNLSLLFLESVCFPRFHVGYIQYKFAANFDLSLQLAEMCSLAAAMPESAALFSLLAYPSFPPLIY